MTPEEYARIKLAYINARYGTNHGDDYLAILMQDCQRENEFMEATEKMRSEIPVLCETTPFQTTSSTTGQLINVKSNPPIQSPLTASSRPTIPDSGERTEFPSGAVRDISKGKGDMMSIPPNALLRLSVHYELGAKKYDRFNFLKGIPCLSFMNSALRHLTKYNAGWDDEDHLAAAVFNILGIMEMEAIKKEMQDIPNRQGKKTFEYPKEIRYWDKPELNEYAKGVQK